MLSKMGIIQGNFPHIMQKLLGGVVVVLFAYLQEKNIKKNT